MRIQVIYRNYKPLHTIYSTLKNYPPEGVDLIFPKPKKYLKKLFPIYKKFGDNFLIKNMILFVQKYLFTKPKSDVDGYYFVQSLPDKSPDKPFIIDFSHVSAFSNFLKFTDDVRKRILLFATDENCKGMVAMSKAAKTTLKECLGDDFEKISSKVKVIYPALPEYLSVYKDKADNSIIKQHSEKLNIIFIGNDVYVKGLHELLEAMKNIENDRIHLYVVSNAPNELKNKYNLKNISYFDPIFSHEEIVTKFFMPADLFVMPSHSELFGMVFLDSLSSGIPVVALKQFSTPEIITDGENGILLNSERLFLHIYKYPDKESGNHYFNEIPEEMVVSQLTNVLNDLEKNRDKIVQMKKNITKDFQDNGKFNTEIRKEKYLEIFKKFA